MNPGQSGCASTPTWTNWASIDWTKVNRSVKSLQNTYRKGCKSKTLPQSKSPSSLAYPFVLREATGYSQSNYQQRQ